MDEGVTPVTTEKSSVDEQGLERAIKEARSNGGNITSVSDTEGRVRRIIEAYLTEPALTWPTAETLDAAFGTYFERDRHHLQEARERVREAFVNNDPVIQALIAYLAELRKDKNAVISWSSLRALKDAADEAGL